MNELLKRGLFCTAIIFLIFSCSKDTSLNNATESSNFTIDLTLAQQTDWPLANEILRLINQHRLTIGQHEILRDQQHASAYAVEHTKYMIDLSAINHDNFNIRSAAMINAGALFVAENVAYGYQTAEDVVEAWLNSPSHRSIIEGNHTHSGFGVLKDEAGRYYFTQLFYQKD